MRFKLIILCFIIAWSNLNSQGFDWQYSSRLPFEPPNSFIGLDALGSYHIINGDFRICDNNIPCDTFSLGGGMAVSAGIKLEYWYSADIAFFSKLGLQYSKVNFINENLFYYMPEIGTKKLEYEYIRNELIPELEFGVKYRLRSVLPHLFTMFSIKTGYVVSSNEELTLRKISEADWLADEIHFAGFEPLQLNQLTVYPVLKLGYDVNLGLGSYASLYLEFGFPLQNRYSTGKWQSSSITAGVSVFPFGF